jgi:hypothetical protein
MEYNVSIMLKIEANVVNAEMEISCSMEDVISLVDSQVGFCSRN